MIVEPAVTAAAAAAAAASAEPSVYFLLALVGATGTILGGFAWIAAWAIKQFDKRLEERFAAQDLARTEGSKAWRDRFERLEKRQEATEADVRRLLIETPREYVRREDHIRFETVIQAKLDAVAARVDLVIERFTKEASRP